jgi:hypothetical protein
MNLFSFPEDISISQLLYMRRMTSTTLFHSTCTSASNAQFLLVLNTSYLEVFSLATIHNRGTHMCDSMYVVK